MPGRPLIDNALVVRRAIAMILMTVPVFFPIVVSLEYDPVWFGILVVVVVELALNSPPTSDVSLMMIYRGVLPFVLAILVLMVALLVFPQIALWMPQTTG